MILLEGGRVVDPSRGTERVASVLIEGSTIIDVGSSLAAPLGATVVDVSGQVVGPGLIDLHSHTHSIAGHRLQALDGVTTALDLEVGLMPVARAYAEAEAEGRPLNFGFSASWSAARAQVLLGRKADASIASSLALLGEPIWQGSSSLTQRAKWLDLLGEELAEGALGIGVLMGYAPHSDPAEFIAVAQLAATAGAPVYSHVRDLVEFDPETPIDGSEELVIAAAETGARMHHCHVNSTSRRHVDRVLGLIERAQAAGSPISVEAYPYGAGSTAVGAAFLAPERLGVWGLRPTDIVLTNTGERIADLSRLREVRRVAPGAACIVEFMDENAAHDRRILEEALSYPDAIVASDAMPLMWDAQIKDFTDWPLPPGGMTHPRTAGTFGRAARWMVRESATWSWVEYFRRCSYLPAKIVDVIAPEARRKGRLAAGADADVVVIDPELFTDVATYLDPLQPSIGVAHLFVAGTPVVRDGAIVTTAFPGRPIRGQAWTPT